MKNFITVHNRIHKKFITGYTTIFDDHIIILKVSRKIVESDPCNNKYFSKILLSRCHCFFVKYLPSLVTFEINVGKLFR